MASPFRYTLIPVFATTVYAYSIFAILCFIAYETVESYNFFVAFVCAVISLVANYRFAMRERTIVSAAVLNGILIALSLFFCFATQSGAVEFWRYLFAGICFAAPVIQSIHLSRSPVTVAGMLRYCEFSIVGTIVMFTLQIGNMEVPSLTNVICIAALVLNVFLLSVLRVKGPAKKADSGRKTFERGTVVSVTFVGIVFAAVFIAVILLPASRNALFGAIYAMRDFFIFAGEAIERFFIFLISLFPARYESGHDVSPGDTGGMGGIENEAPQEMDPNIGVTVFIVCAAIAAVAFIIILIRLRKRRLRGRNASVVLYDADMDDERQFLRTLRGMPARFKAWLFFIRCRFLARGTYESAYLRIVRRSGYKSVRRMASETHKAFLNRAAALFQGKQGTDEGIDRLINTISEAVDRRLYSGKACAYEQVTQGDAKSLALFLSAIGKGKRGQSS